MGGARPCAPGATELFSVHRPERAQKSNYYVVGSPVSWSDLLCSRLYNKNMMEDESRQTEVNNPRSIRGVGSAQIYIRR